MQQATLQIDGMSCGHCVGRVQKALSSLDGVTLKGVSVGSATLEYDESRISAAQIDSAIDAAGFSVLRVDGAPAGS